MQRLIVFLLLISASVVLRAQSSPTAAGKWTGTITQVNYFTGESYPYNFEMNLVQTGNIVTGTTHIWNSKDYAYIEITGTFDGHTLDIVTAKLGQAQIGQNYQWCTIKGKLGYSEATGFAYLSGHSFGRGFSSGDACDMDVIKVKKAIPIPQKKDTTQPVVQKPVVVKKDTQTVVQKPVITPIKRDTAQVVKINSADTATHKLSSKPVEVDEKIVIGKKTVEDIMGRKPKPGKTIEVAQRKVKIRITDNATVDGDSISLYFNEEKLLDNAALTHSPRTVTVELDQNADVNAVILFAENLGRTPPNTALVEIDDGSRKQTIYLESDMERCDIIYLKLKK